VHVQAVLSSAPEHRGDIWPGNPGSFPTEMFALSPRYICASWRFARSPSAGCIAPLSASSTQRRNLQGNSHQQIVRNSGRIGLQLERLGPNVGSPAAFPPAVPSSLNCCGAQKCQCSRCSHGRVCACVNSHLAPGPHCAYTRCAREQSPGARVQSCILCPGDRGCQCRQRGCGYTLRGDRCLRHVRGVRQRAPLVSPAARVKQRSCQITGGQISGIAAFCKALDRPGNSGTDLSQGQRVPGVLSAAEAVA
jgi:hypothetical protein